MKIFTLTLNPAFDVHARADRFALYKESVADIVSRDAGGKGINISRALSAFSCENRAYVLLGKENGEEFAAMLDGYGIPHEDFKTEGRIRENITVHIDGEKETRLSFRGAPSSDGDLAAVEQALLSRVSAGDVVTFTGSVPSGMTHARIHDLLSRLRARGVQLVIDSKSIGREELIDLRPALIKPNAEEVSAVIGKEVSSLSECLAGAKELSLAGIGNVIVSFGEEGACLASSGCVFTANAPKIRAVSTIGAGDSMIAGFLYAASAGQEASECLRYAVAFGTAACLTEGTNPPRKEDVSALLPQITVQPASL